MVSISFVLFVKLCTIIKLPRLILVLDKKESQVKKYLSVGILPCRLPNLHFSILIFHKCNRLHIFNH